MWPWGTTGEEPGSGALLSSSWCNLGVKTASNSRRIHRGVCHSDDCTLFIEGPGPFPILHPLLLDLGFVYVFVTVVSTTVTAS